MHDIIVIQNQFGVKAIHRFHAPFADKDRLFEALNGYGPNANLRNRISVSMTARDYLCVDGVWWFCAPFGWEEVLEPSLIDSVIQDVMKGAFR